MSLVLYLLRGACSPFSALKGQKCSHEKETFPLLLKLNSQSPHTYPLLHALVFYFKSRSMFFLPLQSKSPVSFAKIPVQPPAQSFACEQQQARVYP